MIPVEDAEHYYSKRHRKALAMAEATADLAVRNIHLDMARQYAKLAGAEPDAPVAVSGPSGELMAEQLVMRISTVMTAAQSLSRRIDCASTTQVTNRLHMSNISIVGAGEQVACPPG
jgi:hypothetical protein